VGLLSEIIHAFDHLSTQLALVGLRAGLIKFGILFLDAKFAKNKNSKLPKLSGCLYV
jgi:hypothetical protein